MDAKAYLDQARQADRRIAALMERRRHYIALGEGRSQEARARLEALEGELDRRVGAYAEIVREIEGVIDGLEDERQRDVLRYRYLNGWDWRRIAGEMCFSENWVWRLHARALGEVTLARGLDWGD